MKRVIQRGKTGIQQHKTGIFVEFDNWLEWLEVCARRVDAEGLIVHGRCQPYVATAYMSTAVCTCR